MLISWMIFTKLFYPKQLRSFKEELSSRPDNRKQYSNSVTLNILWFSILLIFVIFNVVPAVIISYECNKGSIFHLILAFLFSDIYVLHYTIRRFVLRENYCYV